MLEYIFFLLVPITIVILLVGLIKPKAVIKWGNNEKKTRKRVLLYYGLATIVFFIAFVATIPELTPEEKTALAIKKEEQQIKRDAEKKIEEEDAKEASEKKEQAEIQAEDQAIFEAATMADLDEADKIDNTTDEIEIGVVVDSETSVTENIEVKSEIVETEVDKNVKVTSSDPKGFAFKSERKKTTPSKVAELMKEELIYLTTETSFYGMGSPYWKRTLTEGDLIYYGGLKDNMPSGFGIVLETEYSDNGNELYIPRYIGNFKKGKFAGYGRLYSEAVDYYNQVLDNTGSGDLWKFGITFVTYEGYFDNNEFEGEGNDYQLQDNSKEMLLLEAYIDEHADEMRGIADQWSSENDSMIFAMLPPIKSILQVTGIYKNDQLNGKAKSYVNGQLNFDGEYKDNRFSGEGKLYFMSGKLEYEGDFKASEYHGTGTLYKEDGSVVYEGEWSEGDVK